MAEILQQDVRRGLPSASSLERYDTCPGAFAMEQGLPDVSSEIAEQGTLLHAVLAGEKDYSALTLDEQELIDKARAIEEKLVGDLLGTVDCQVLSEDRLWYPSKEEPIFSGQFDRMYIAGDRGLLLDFKMGFIPVQSIERNLQLRAYAVLAWKAYGITDISVGVIQPRCGVTFELCRYTEEDLVKAEADILRILDSVKDANARRSPSQTACKYCKAKAVCPDTIEKVESIVPLRTVDMTKKLELMPNAKLAQLLHSVFLADEIVKAVKDEAKQRLEKDPDCLPGWGMVPNPATREVTSVIGAYKAIQDYFEMEASREGREKPDSISPALFMAACKMGVKQLEEIIGQKFGLKGKPLKEKMESLLGDYLVLKPKAPSLKNLKGAD